MDANDEKRTAGPVVTIVERRRHGSEELTSAEVIRIDGNRKKRSRGSRKGSNAGK